MTMQPRGFCRRAFERFARQTRALPLCAILAMLAGANVFAAGEPGALSDPERAAGWKLLFDGKSSAGWLAIGKTVFPERGWFVREGALVHAARGGGGDLVTAEAFDDFEVSFAWKISDSGNSGVKYNLPDRNNGVGFEYQILGPAERTGALHRSGALYDLIEPRTEPKLRPAGEWNEGRIRVDGAHVEHWLNGEKTVEFELGSDLLKAAIARSKYRQVVGFGEKVKSPILLQDHGGEVAFRALKLRALPAK